MQRFSPCRRWVKSASPQGASSTDPEIYNFDMAIEKSIQGSESKSLEFRLEAFNAFNHAQFYGPAAVNGNTSSANFGEVVSAAGPRLVQLAGKFSF